MAESDFFIEKCDYVRHYDILNLNILMWFRDISWLDWAYKSFTCDVMYRRQRRHIYYGGEI
jgi:hypothetical protein